MDIEYGLFEVLKNPVSALTSTEVTLVNYILKHPDAVLNMSIQELAACNDTSPSAITRLCKKLDIQNYKNFKIYLSKSLERERIHSNDEEISTSIYGSFYQDVQTSMKKTMTIFDESQVQAVSKLIYESETVYVYGIGFSKEVSDNIFKKWNILGKSVIVITERDTGVISVTNNSTKSIFIGVSNSGNSKDVTYVLDRALKSGVPTVAITNYKYSKMSQRADYVIYSGEGSDIPNFNSYALYAQLLIVDLLYLNYVDTYGAK